MSNVKFSRCIESHINSVPITDGQFIYIEDKHSLYMDNGNNRSKISDVVEAADITQIASPILEKIYFDEATEKLYKAKSVNNAIVWIDLTGTETAFKPFPASFDTTHSTQQFFSSVRTYNPEVGMAYLGGVRLTDMPADLINSEIELYVYPNQVYFAVMRSSNLYPYIWQCNSHAFRGWEPLAGATALSTSFDKTNTELESTNVEDAIKELDTRIGDINAVLDIINGEDVVEGQLAMDILNEVAGTQDDYEGLGATEEEIIEVFDEILGVDSESSQEEEEE